MWVVDKLFKTNNSSIVTDLINTHISRWISDISDLSNGSAESIKRLEEYKYAVNEIREKVDPYALSNNIKMKMLQENNGKISSKRVMGVVILFTLLILFIYKEVIIIITNIINKCLRI